MPDYAIVATGTRPYQHLLCQRPAAVEAARARALVIVGGAGACESRLSTDLDSGSGASTGGGLDTPSASHRRNRFLYWRDAEYYAAYSP